MIHGLEIVEYSPTEVKQAVVGQGHADKEQVARMVQLLVGKQEFDTADASDGLALAICHAHFVRQAATTASAHKTPAARAYAEALQSASGKRKKKGSSLADALGLSAESVAGRRRISFDKIK
jgi:hypothetical protein